MLELHVTTWCRRGVWKQMLHQAVEQLRTRYRPITEDEALYKLRSRGLGVTRHRFIPKATGTLLSCVS